VNLRRLVLVAAFAAVLTLGLASAAPGGNFDEQRMGCTGENPGICPTGTTGTPYSIPIELLGDEDEGCAVYSVSSGNLPPGLSVNSDGARIEGTPTQAGTFDFFLTVKYTRHSGCPFKNPSDDPFRISINEGLAKLTIGPESAPVGTVGTAYSLQMTATVAEAKTWSISSGTLPPGLALDASTGLISGTPTAAGLFEFQVLAKMNTDQRSDTKSLGVTIRDPLAITGPTPLATSPAPTLWEVGVPFSATLAGTGGTGSYTWSLLSGSLPTGVTLGSDGTISGTPRAAGVYRSTLRLSDDEGRTVDYAANFGVAARLKVATLALRAGRVGRPYRSKVSSTGGIEPRKWKITQGPLPKFVRFDRLTGILSGTPKKAGRYRLVFEITDGLEVVATKRLRIDVLP
jgi:hypothetical protein